MPGENHFLSPQHFFSRAKGKLTRKAEVGAEALGSLLGRVPMGRQWGTQRVQAFSSLCCQSLGDLSSRAQLSSPGSFPSSSRVLSCGQHRLPRLYLQHVETAWRYKELLNKWMDGGKNERTLLHCAPNLSFTSFPTALWPTSRAYQLFLV